MYLYMYLYLYLVFTHAYMQLVPVGRRQELLHYSQEMWWKYLRETSCIYR